MRTLERTLDFVPASTVQLRATLWVWADRIPLGELTLLAGREGLGKSTIAYELAAALTCGDLVGDFYDAPKGVAVCATEDSWEHTIAPRLHAADAELDRVFHIVVHEGEFGSELNLPEDLEALEQLVIKHDVGLILLDPLLSRLDSSLDTHKTPKYVRRWSRWWNSRDRARLRILEIIHVNKGLGTDALTSIMGSRAFTAVARSVLFVMKDPDDEEVRVIGRPKSNLASGNVQPQQYHIETVKVGYDEEVGKEITAGRIVWGDYVDSSIDALLDGSNKGPSSKVDKAAAWLQDFLRKAPEHRSSSRILKDRGEAAGFDERTLKRAMKRAGVTVVGEGCPRKTWWVFDGTEGDP